MKASHHKPSRPFHRKIHLGNEIWSWRMSGAYIWIRSPKGKITVATTAYEVNGSTEREWADYHFEQRYPTSKNAELCPVVTPKIIKETIEKNRNTWEIIHA